MSKKNKDRKRYTISFSGEKEQVYQDIQTMLQKRQMNFSEYIYSLIEHDLYESCKQGQTSDKQSSRHLSEDMPNRRLYERKLLHYLERIFCWSKYAALKTSKDVEEFHSMSKDVEHYSIKKAQKLIESCYDADYKK